MQVDGCVKVPRRAKMGGCPEGSPRVLLGLSIGNHRCYGPYLAKTLKMLHHKGAREVVLFVGDTLQAHNIKTTAQPTGRDWKTAELMGDRWLEYNADVLRESPLPVKLYWSRYHTDDPSCEERRRELASAIDADPEMKKSLENSIEEFAARSGDRFTRSKSLGYLLEELPIFDRFVREKIHGDWIDAICYPGSMAPIVHMVVERAFAISGRPQRVPVLKIDFTLSKETWATHEADLGGA